MSEGLSRRAFFGRGRTTAAAPSPPARQIAAVSGACLATQGIACGTCSDPCDPRALRLRPIGQGRAIPLIDSEACTGCGDCLAVCPVSALSLVPLPAPASQETSPCA